MSEVESECSAEFLESSSHSSVHESVFGNESLPPSECSLPRSESLLESSLGSSDSGQLSDAPASEAPASEALNDLDCSEILSASDSSQQSGATSSDDEFSEWNMPPEEADVWDTVLHDLFPGSFVVLYSIMY